MAGRILRRTVTGTENVRAPRGWMEAALAAHMRALLTPREEIILRARFREGHTLRALGERFAVSASRVRQIQERGLSKLDPTFREQLLDPLT